MAEGHYDDGTYELEPVQETSKHSAGSGFLGFVIFIIAVLALTWGLQTYVCRAYEIPSESMTDTLEVGDHIWSEKVSYYFEDPQAGDIVTFIDPLDSDRTLIKRVIATEGQTVDLIDGYVYVDGVKLEESYTEGKPSYPLQTADGVEVTYPYTVPEGYVWVMGDNRTNSSDSRYFGAIPVSSITGRACFIYYPFDRLGAL
jgi:signal peptidase I